MLEVAKNVVYKGGKILAKVIENAFNIRYYNILVVITY